MRWVGRVLGALVILALLPLALTLLYRLPAVPAPSTLMMRDAVTLQGYDRRWVPIDQMGTAIIHSVMMSEDGQFCAHKGVDWPALNAVIEDAMSGERTRGASTITMQTAKNLFLWHGRSMIRKGIEVPLSLYLDAVLPKRRIMEIYLNIAEWGPNIYGVEAAAQHHFGRSAQDLSARQAALLAVTLPNPRHRDPANPGQGLSRLAGTIEARANQAGAYVSCLR
ncbi:monofunctional biosynthetic peptidoglycan transglycosylase [Mesorhizobium sp. YIM 152430]|uniref:monofunctional biosynthetic peptidoglycan transglycosylase n=1 Tax=Mesorhizobium sp. YIM 152430 TaxID=3031761 RepID=UPI0023D99C91|nr:monofunctional biosynthetic peptidoglycan transglycosylase [Mesorhizobium sp. YIM 152430]MDF1599512.1 monofunctional biosynthetic peptidoglycan transglycosylase [Mesorhizobium sp. YIM 152430]